MPPEVELLVASEEVTDLAEDLTENHPTCDAGRGPSDHTVDAVSVVTVLPMVADRAAACSGVGSSLTWTTCFIAAQYTNACSNHWAWAHGRDRLLSAVNGQASADWSSGEVSH